MQPFLIYDSSLFCSRDDVESLQLLTKPLLKMIVKGSKVLPLRPIRNVEMYGETIKIFLKLPDAGNKPDYEASTHSGDFPEIFYRLQHSCITDFYFEVRNSPFVGYWKQQKAASFTVMSINFDLPKPTKYEILDSIVTRLQPESMQIDVKEREWNENFSKSEKIKLLARESFRTSLQTCGLNVWAGAAFPPAAFFLEEPGYPNYQLKCYDPNVVDGIKDLIESFKRDGCANTKLDSVCFGWADRHGNPYPTLELLNGEPTESDMQPPNVDEVAPFLVPSDGQISKCEVHAFENKDLCKQLVVYKWRVEYKLRGGFGGRGTTHVLLCRVVDI